jgi:hypothetical protein
MNKWLENLKTLVAELEVENTKFEEKGNNSAGTRARKLLQDIKITCQEGRNAIQDVKIKAKN